MPNGTNKPQYSAPSEKYITTQTSFMLPRLYVPALCQRFALRRYASSLQKPVTQNAPAKSDKVNETKTEPKKRVSTKKSTITVTKSDEPLSEEDLVKQIENIRFMSKAHPTFDPWGQHVETLGALCGPAMPRFTPDFHKKRRYTTLSCKFCHPITISKCSCHAKPVSQKPFERRQERSRVSRYVDINTSTNLLSACGLSHLQMRFLVLTYPGRVVSRNSLQAGHGGYSPQSPQRLGHGWNRCVE